MVTYTKDTRMHTGRKYAGDKLGNIPPSYFIWLYDVCRIPKGPLRDYIEKNLERFRKDAKRQAMANSR